MSLALVRAGDRIDVVAPGFAVRAEALDAGLRRLAAMGFEPVVGASVRRRSGYFAGADADRAADLGQALADGGASGVWFARGGYGTARILDSLDWRALRRRRKTVVGYSDATALFAAAARHRGAMVCLHAPVVSELGDRSAYHAPSLTAALAGKPVAVPFPRSGVLLPGRAEGTLLGGNLTVLVHLLGTRHFPDLRGAILLLEDVGEEIYRLDRLLSHLAGAGALGGVRAVVLGSLDPPPPKRAFPPDPPLRRMLLDRLGPLGVPVACGLPLGHRPGKWTVPLGGAARLDTSRGRLVAEPPRH